MNITLHSDWDLEDVSDPIEDGDSEEQWMVNEKTDVDEASSVLVEEHNSLPSEADSDSLLSDRTSFLSGSPNMGWDIIHFNPENPFELSKIWSSDNHNVSKELNAKVIEENILTIIGSPSMMGDFVHFNTENSSKISELVSLDNLIVAKIITTEGL
nr:hypothetical protein [Tanacetum cinerariifolium]